MPCDRTLNSVMSMPRIPIIVTLVSSILSSRTLFSKTMNTCMDISFDDIIKNPAFEIFVGIVAAYALFKVGEYAYKKFKNSGGD